MEIQLLTTYVPNFSSGDTLHQDVVCSLNFL
jgi:hypothetical protein